MSEGKTIREIHLGFVELLKVRGEEVVQPRGKPMCVTYGYDKTIGLISAGSIFYKKEDGTYDLLQDHLVHAYTGVKLENLGLCDARCWYEAIDDNRVHEEKRSVCKSMNWKKAADCNNSECDDYQICASKGQNYHFESEQTAVLAELCININEGQAVVSPDGKIEFNDTGLNISLRDLQFVVQEAEAYMKYRKERNAQTETH